MASELHEARDTVPVSKVVTRIVSNIEAVTACVLTGRSTNRKHSYVRFIITSNFPNDSH